MSVTQSKLSAVNTDRHDNAVEQPVSISVNGIAYAVMMVTPSDLENFAVGFAHSEGIITAIDQLRDLRISEDLHYISATAVEIPVDCIVIDLHISPRQFHIYKEKRRFRRSLTSCGLCGSEALSEALPDLKALQPARLPDPELFSDLHNRVRFQTGLHIAQLMSPSGKRLISQQDIGRHNALDKVLGFALQEKINLHEHYVILSSRCSVELVQKAVNAGLSTLVHLSSPSNLAIHMAEHYQLNLMQINRAGKITVHADSHADRTEL